MTSIAAHFVCKTVHDNVDGDDVVLVMPLEIADSDADSDLASPVKQRRVLEDGDEQATLPQASLSVIDFDQFLDPTQRLSSSASDLICSISQLDGAGGTSISGVAHIETATTQPIPLGNEMSPPTRSKKRAQSALYDSYKDVQRDSSQPKPKAKRAKTYGAGSRFCTARDDGLFAQPPTPSAEARSPNSAPVDDIAADHDLSSLQPPSADATLLLSTSPSGKTSQDGKSLIDSCHRMTTSMASMGQYQSINIDLRGSRQGIDLNTNPFASLSQVSLEEDHHQPGTGQISALNGAVEEQSLYTDADPLLFPLGCYSANQALADVSGTSPGQPLAIGPAKIMQGEEGAAIAAGLKIYRGIAGDTMLASMEKPHPKKRGRKAKDSRISSNSPAPSFTEEADELALPQPNRSRRGTGDSMSQASEISSTTASTRKRKRRKSKQVMEQEPQANLADSCPVKHPANGINLSDEATIGLPEALYNSRPSRSQSKIVEEEARLQAQDSSPAKHLTNELILSDEAAIGLPRESYKPRPSRSRSKKAANDDALMLPPLQPEIDLITPAKGNTCNIPDTEPQKITPAKSSTKKGRKSKVKRAKTSAAALLKKTDAMLSDGEEDVVWMDSKPAPVKLDLPPDLKGLKKEPDALNETNQDGDDDKKRTRAKESNITIELPTSTEAMKLVAEPKKRGRKPKNAPKKSEDKNIDEDEEELQNESALSRPALAEKSSNVAASNDKSVGKAQGKAPTVSPLTSPEPADKPQPEAINSCDLSKENAPPNTPAKGKAAAPPSSAEKGPTKHSPITSLSSSGRKTLYRVGLSRRQHIPSLLRKVQRDKPPPKNVARKEKETKKMKDAYAEYEGADCEHKDPGEMRGADGMLIEWEF